MNSCVYKLNEKKSDTLIIAFAGHAILFGGIQRFEFVKFLSTHFSHAHNHFYADQFRDLFHKGICGISHSIDETTEYLKKEIEPYKHVIFLGVSSGGYAAILFGSLLNIKAVLAFIPQTIRRNKIVDEKYRDLNIHINNKTKYYIYGDASITNEKDFHHISHCERIAHHPNVFLTRMQSFRLKEMRDNGELAEILNNLIES